MNTRCFASINFDLRPQPEVAMSNLQKNLDHTKTTQFFYNLNKFVYFFGLPSFWVEDVDLPDKFKKFFDRFTRLSNFCVFVLVLSEYGSFITQKNLSEKQKSNLLLFSISHSIITYFRVRVSYQKDEIAAVTYSLGIALKRVHNDSQVEARMIRKATLHSSALVLNCFFSVVFMTYEVVAAVIWSGATFTTVVTAYPDVQDPSVSANILRAVFNIFWWIFLTRVFSVYALVICLASCLSHQFTNLQSYFLSLNDIFKGDASQEVMEESYELGVKVGIQMHSETMRCTYQIQVICRDVFSGQIVFNLVLLIVLMYQMTTSERSLTNVFTLVTTALTILMSTGFFMWNAGDITVEAASLPTAMYSSGWQNCSGPSSVRIRNLLVIAMHQAQQPVVLKGLGIIELSYSSYVSIVKSSYSVFSVIY